MKKCFKYRNVVTNSLLRIFQTAKVVMGRSYIIPRVISLIYSIHMIYYLFSLISIQYFHFKFSKGTINIHNLNKVSKKYSRCNVRFNSIICVRS